MSNLKTWKKLYSYLLPDAPSFWKGSVLAIVGMVILHFSNYYLRHLVDALIAGDSVLAWR
jgi:hypothetical protein